MSFTKEYPSKYPNTVPITKNSSRNMGRFNISDLYDGKPNHSSASLAPRRQQSQQVFVSNQKR